MLKNKNGRNLIVVVLIIALIVIVGVVTIAFVMNKDNFLNTDNASNSLDANNQTSSIIENNNNGNNSDGWNDYSFYINDYKIELPMKFNEFDKLITKNSNYRLSHPERFYNGSGIDDDKLLSGEIEEFYYLNQYGDTISEQYYLSFTLKNESDETLPNEDCTVVGVGIGDLLSSINNFDKNIKFTSKKLYIGMEMTEEKLINTFGNYDDFSSLTYDDFRSLTYRFGKFVYGLNTNYSFQVSIKNNVISQLQIDWLDKSVDN